VARQDCRGCAHGGRIRFAPFVTSSQERLDRRKEWTRIVSSKLPERPHEHKVSNHNQHPIDSLCVVRTGLPLVCARVA
jgi:hypothetical protein